MKFLIKLYDGRTGLIYEVTDIINDGKEEFLIDPEILDVIRWEGEGGLVRDHLTLG